MKLEDPFGLVGTLVDSRYRVERVAGQGGFGVVYRAHHLAFDSAIALKVLNLPEHWPKDKKRARILSFQREGRVLFELSQLHPSIVRAFETGTVTSSDGAIAPYLALEWLDGLSLDRELGYRQKHGLAPFELPAVLALLHQPALGLARAHARGIVHRDIKPANLFVSLRDGEPNVKILDFGIAKIIDDSVDTTSQPLNGGVATSSFTPKYAAPEQWLRRLGPSGTWTDVHAWALVCVELLTGRAPLSGEEATQFMAACLDPARPTPIAHGLSVSPEVEAVFARGLALNPRERFPDLGAFWRALCVAADWGPERPAVSVEIAALEEGAANLERNGSHTEVSPAPASLDGAATSPTASRAFSRSQEAGSLARRRRSSTARWGVGLALAALGFWLARPAFHSKPSEAALASTKSDAPHAVSPAPLAEPDARLAHDSEAAAPPSTNAKLPPRRAPAPFLQAGRARRTPMSPQAASSRPAQADPPHAAQAPAEPSANPKAAASTLDQVMADDALVRRR